MGKEGILAVLGFHLAHTGFGAVHDESVYTVP
jgi:hypothetical protein